MTSHAPRNWGRAGEKGARGRQNTELLLDWLVGRCKASLLCLYSLFEYVTPVFVSIHSLNTFERGTLYTGVWQSSALEVSMYKGMYKPLILPTTAWRPDVPVHSCPLLSLSFSSRSHWKVESGREELQLSDLQCELSTFDNTSASQAPWACMHGQSTSKGI